MVSSCLHLRHALTAMAPLPSDAHSHRVGVSRAGLLIARSSGSRTGARYRAVSHCAEDQPTRPTGRGARGTPTVLAPMQRTDPDSRDHHLWIQKPHLG